MHKKTGKRIIACLLSALMALNAVPITAFAQTAPKAIPEDSIQEESISDGMFYFASSGVEISENDPDSYRLYVRRAGDGSGEASVRVTMLDVNARYGKDYTVTAEGDSLLHNSVKNQKNSTSIEEYMIENSDVQEEYNYSDAIIDGSITSEDQMSDEEMENFEFTEEEKEELISTVNEVAEFLNNDGEISSTETEEAVLTETTEEKSEIIEEAVEEKIETVEENPEEMPESIEEAVEGKFEVIEESAEESSEAIEESAEEASEAIEESAGEETGSTIDNSAAENETEKESTVADPEAAEEKPAEEALPEVEPEETASIPETAQADTKEISGGSEAASEIVPEEVSESAFAEDPEIPEVEVEAEPGIETVKEIENIEIVSEIDDVTESEETADSVLNGAGAKLATPSVFASLGEAKSYATGLPNDRQEMAVTGQTAYSITDDLSIDSVGYMDDSIALVGNALSSAYLILRFADGETEKYLDIRTIDNAYGEGDKQSGFNLSAENGEQISGLYGNFTLRIIDDDPYEPAVVSFSDTDYYPENGYITVTVKRTGNFTGISTVMLDTENITAQEIRDYSKVHAQVIFGFGISERKIKIPVVSEYLTEDVSFRLKLQEPADCVLGENDTAAAHIRKEDISFDAAAFMENQGEEAVESEEAAFLSGTGSINLKDVLYGEPLDLGKAVYSSGSQGSGSYSKLDGSNWVLYSKDDWNDVSSWAAFSLGERHYDYRGMEVEWARSSGKPNYGWTKFKYYDCDTEGQNGWKNFYYKSTERWSKGSDHYYLAKGIKSLREIDFELRREGGWAGTSPKLTISRLRPILRPFEIGLVASDSVSFIDNTGNIRPNTQIPGMEKENVTELLNSNDNTLITTSGHSITVKLNDASFATYISGLEIVSWDGTKSKVIASGYGENTRSISLDINNDLIRNNLSYISFSEIGGGLGDYGRFKVRAIIKPKQATVRVKKDSRAQIRVDNLSPSESADYYVYQCNVGDCLRYHINLTEEASASYTWNQIRVNPVRPEGKPYAVFREKDAGGTGLDYAADVVKASETEIIPTITIKNNRLIVRVKEADVSAFDTSAGIFANQYEVNNGYREYVIDDNADRIPGKEYVLKASSKRSGYMPVWREQFSRDVEFSQNEFYFTGTGETDTNVLYLTVGQVPGVLRFVVSGTVYYDETVLGGSTSAESWYPASGAYYVVDSTHYGVADAAGNFMTMPFNGVLGDYVKCRLSCNGSTIYRTVRLTGREYVTVEDPHQQNPDGSPVKVKCYKVSEGNIVITSVSSDRVRFGTVRAQSVTTGISGDISINGNATIITANLELIDPKTEKEYTYTYTDEKGVEHTVTENVTDVKFLVVDPITHKIKSTFDAKQNEKYKNEWTFSQAFETGYYAQYRSGDLLFAKMITDRKAGDGTGLNICEYAPVNTGIVFTEPNPSSPKIVDINFDTSEFCALPIIGKLTTFVNAVGLSFGIDSTPTGGVRIFFGKQIKPQNSHFDGNGKITSDTGFVYGISDVTKVKDMFRDMSDMIGTFGEKNKLGAMSLGIPAWSIQPFAGVYFEFSVYHDAEGPVKTKYLFTGGGGYIGITGSFRYTYYMLICGVPVYVGGDVSLTLIGEFGIAPDDGTQIPFNDPDQELIDSLIKNSHFEFIFRSVLIANAYAGVGICGTVGIRGGFQLTLSFIWNPTIKRAYKDMREVGFAVTGGIKFWVDAILLSIPIPVYTWDNWLKLGYFEDLEKKQSENGGSLLGAVSGAEIVKKKRSDKPASYVANEPDGEEADFLGGKVISEQLRYETEENRLIKDGFDDPQQKLLNFTDASGREKILMVYLEDDLSRSDDERTSLMYTVYDVESDTWWEEPKAVYNDGTADFAPNLCDAGDRIVLSWASRNKDHAIGEGTAYADYLSSLEIFTADFVKDSQEVKNVLQMTSDKCYDTTPKAFCNPETGDIVLTYLKADVPAAITNAEDLLKASTPELNRSEVMYMLYDGTEKKWITDKYFDAEVAEGVDKNLLLSAFGGQRFLASPLPEEGMNDPAIADLDVSMVSMITYTKEQLDSERQSLYGSLGEGKSKDIGNGAGTLQSVQSYSDSIGNMIRASMKNMGIFTYSVDTDANLATDKDREIYAQVYDFEEHKAGKPIRITRNQVNDSQPQIAHCEGKDYLCWLSDGKKISYIDLTSLLLESRDGDYIGEASTAGVDVSSGLEEGAEITSFRVFSRVNNKAFEAGEDGVECDDLCDIYLAWQGRSDISIGSEFAEDIYVSAFSLSSDAADISQGSWSGAVRMTYNGKLNEIPEFAALPGDQVMMVGNRFNLNSQEAGDTYETTDVELVEMTYRPAALLTIENIEIERYPESADDKFDVTVSVRNKGFKAAMGFLLLMYMSAGENAEESEIVAAQGVYADNLEPGTIGTLDIPVTISKEMYERRSDFCVLSLILDSQGIAFEEYLMDDKLQADLSGLSAKQSGDEFVITGIIANKSPVFFGSDEKLRIFENGNPENILAEYTVSELGINKYGMFEARVPAVKELCGYGYEDLGVVIIDRTGCSCSNYEFIRAYVEYPFGISVNGLTNGGTFKLKEGESLALSASYAPSEFFRNAGVKYSVDDTSIASVEYGKLIGRGEGTTRLHVTVDPYGGEADFIITVGSGKKHEESDDSEGYIPQGPAGAKRMTGRWIQNSGAKDSWSFLSYDGKKFTGWGYISTAKGWDYYHIGEDGIMDYGWYYDETEKKWYYLKEVHDGTFGSMVRGWYLDAQDSRWYYLDERNGAMRTGWIQLRGLWYYLNQKAEALTWKQGEDGVWSYQGSGRPYGSMYANEMTPDGYRVNSNGEWIR